MKTKLISYKNKIIVQIEKQDELKSKSGLILIENNNNNIVQGKIYSIDTSIIPLHINDTILFDKTKAIFVKVEDEEFYIIEDKDVLAKYIVPVTEIIDTMKNLDDLEEIIKDMKTSEELKGEVEE